VADLETFEGGAKKAKGSKIEAQRDEVGMASWAGAASRSQPDKRVWGTAVSSPSGRGAEPHKMKGFSAIPPVRMTSLNTLNEMFLLHRNNLSISIINSLHPDHSH